MTFHGYRTYATCLVILALLLAHWKGWLSLPTEAYAGLFALALAFLRAAIGRVDEDQAAKP